MEDSALWINKDHSLLEELASRGREREGVERRQTFTADVDVMIERLWEVQRVDQRWRVGY
jgi:hypothetical protein